MVGILRRSDRSVPDDRAAVRRLTDWRSLRSLAMTNQLFFLYIFPERTINNLMQTQPLRLRRELTLKPKREYFWSQERRRYVRYPSGWRVRFCGLTGTSQTFSLGRCKNLSEGGMKITCLESLERGAVVLLEVDLNLLAKHIKVDHVLKIKENRILAEVKWRHLNLETRLFEAGLEFIETHQAKEYETSVTRANAIP